MPTILIADQDEDTRFILSQALRHKHLNVLEAVDPREAHALARSGVDVIILNYPMRFPSGITLTRVIRADERLSSTPILNLTSHVTAALLADARADGVTRTLPKPAGVDTIVEMINALLVKRPGRPPWH